MRHVLIILSTNWPQPFSRAQLETLISRDANIRRSAVTNGAPSSKLSNTIAVNGEEPAFLNLNWTNAKRLKVVRS